MNTNQTLPSPKFVGPGYDWTSLSGVVLGGPRGSLFGVRVGWIDAGKLINAQHVEDHLDRTGDYATGGRFARISMANCQIAWAADGDQRVVGQIEATADGDFVLECYPALDFPHRTDPCSHTLVGPPFVPYVNPARFTAPTEGIVRGESCEVVVEPGHSLVTGGWVEISGRSVGLIADRAAPRDQFVLQSAERPDAEGHSPTAPDAGFNIPHDRSVWLRWKLQAGQRIHFAAEVGETLPDQIIRPTATEIESHIAQGEAKHRSEGLQGTGPLADMAAPMAHELAWMSCWHPFERRAWSPPGHHIWLSDGRFNVWGWDEHFNAVIADLSDPALANGCNFIGGNDKRVGAYSTWCLYARNGDLDFLRAAYNRLRPTQPPGDVELDDWTGAGMDDSPMHTEDREVAPLWGLDMTCYKALNAELMGRIAAALGLTEDAQAYRESHAAIGKTINEVFWNEEDGIYRNRYQDGGWAPTETPTSFYPWFTGLVPPERSRRLLTQLLDPKKFWGEWVIPSISRSHPVYGKPATKKLHNMIMPPYSYWRGSIWPPTCYLVYEGLKRAKHHSEASQFATKCVALWRKNWTLHGYAPENFNPETGELSDAAINEWGEPHRMSAKHQSWSMLLPLIGLKELVDLEIWHDNPAALRFGSLDPAASSIKNWRWRGSKLDIAQQDGELTLYRDGQLVFRSTGGPAVVRSFEMDDSRVHSFEIESASALEVEISHWENASEKTYCRLTPGTNRVIVSDHKATATQLNPNQS